MLCKGRVKWSICATEGKTLILTIAEPGEVLGLSATVSGKPYELTAETIDPCQINFAPYRWDIFQLARYASDKGLRVALATNGTLVTKDVARMIVDAGVRRVSISLAGADDTTHDTFRGIPGA